MFYLRLHMYGRLRLLFYALALFNMKHLEPRSNFHDRSRPIVETPSIERGFILETPSEDASEGRHATLVEFG